MPATMHRDPAAPFRNGALVGLVLAVALTAWLAAFGTMETVTLVDGAAAVVASGTGMWTSVLVGSAVGGALLTGLTYAVGRALEPEAPRFPLRYLVPVGLALSIALGYSVVRLGATMVGHVGVDGVVTISVSSLVIVTALAGALTGSITAPIVDALARPATIGANEALPASGRQVLVDMARAVGVPLLAVAAIALVAVSLAQVLLGQHSAVVAVAIFAGVAATILGGTTLLALRPWERRGASS